jgi:uncharacterized damage-inducible protein DinB
MTISQSLLPEYDREMANTRRLLELVPDGKFDYKPHPKSMTMAQLATHIAWFPSWAKDTLSGGGIDIPADFKPPLAKSRAELLAMFDESVGVARKKLESTSDAEWSKVWTLSFAGKKLMEMPRIEVMRGMVLNHMIHHRGQLGVYLRLNEVAIPGMYGPSADEPNMFRAEA